jgi:hypothetical protein
LQTLVGQRASADTGVPQRIPSRSVHRNVQRSEIVQPKPMASYGHAPWWRNSGLIARDIVKFVIGHNDRFIAKYFATSKSNSTKSKFLSIN